MKIEYMSNNSGGDWWLKDKDWIALEKAGWEVAWVKYTPNFLMKEGEDRWLGALAKKASKEFASVYEAIQEFEKITKQDVSDEGCSCCGAPHCFSWYVEGRYMYCEGEGCLKYMYSNPPTTLREAAERLDKEGVTWP